MSTRKSNVLLKAATLDEIRSGGNGWRISAGFAESPFGICLIADSPRGICFLSFPKQKNTAALKAVQKSWPNASVFRDDLHAGRLARHIFKKPGKSKTSPKPLRVLVKGTPFQIQVWQSLLEIPCGAVTSYGRLASLVKKPRASRAVGTAVGRNPLTYLIPCHRVIRGDGVLGNYYWGPAMKRAMLAWEGIDTSGL